MPHGTQIGSAFVPTFVTATDGARIAVRVAAPSSGSTASGRPVLLVHGLGSSGYSNWERTGWVRALSATVRRRLFLVDLRGHGDSDAPPDWTRYAVTTLLDDLGAVLDHLAPGEPVDAVGYSLGARLLTGLTSWLPAGRIARLVLGGMADQPLLQHIDVDAIGAAALQGSGAAGMDRETARILLTLRLLPGNDVVALSELVRGLQADPATAMTPPTPTIPTVVAVGTEDAVFDRAARWAASMPDGRFVEIPGRNHVSAVPSRVFRDAAVAFLG